MKSYQVEEMEDIERIFNRLSSNKKLERDRGSNEFQSYLSECDPESFQSFSNFFITSAEQIDSDKPWEFVFGILAGIRILIIHPWATGDLCDTALTLSKQHLLHDEYRVRIAAGECLGDLCKKLGTTVYSNCKQMILDGIRENLERDTTADEPGHSGYESDTGAYLSSSPNRSHRSSSPTPSDKIQIFHDTAGWKNLETWMKCLQSVIDGCGVQFNSQIDQGLLDLLFSALVHTNRFVRETGYQVCASLVSCNSHPEAVSVPSREDNSILKYGEQLAENLARGLADNWSQVRLAASVATRQFLHAVDDEARLEYMDLLLPRMCLNRYYVAEGVRIYSQDTWKQITEGHGKDLVEQFIQPTVQFYVAQSEADNHAVREAACACIAELATKLDKDRVRPHVSKLLDTLKVCFQDDSWPVRDAACVASGNFMFSFPEESKPYIPQMMPMFIENLEDNIPSVRSGAALALLSIVKTFGDDVSGDLLSLIETSLKDIENQSANTDKYSGLEKGPATYSVVKRARDNDPDLHTDKTMYSCGSLAPKMGRGGGKDKGGCMHSTFRRPAEAWEKAEGCIHLYAELTQVNSLHQKLSQMLPLLSQAASHKHYTQHIVLLETLCKRLPEIARNLGKRLFKPTLEQFLDPIFYALASDNALTSSAASQCLNQMSNILGPNILRGRVENHNPQFMQLLEANIAVAPM